jgi:anti-anti-sigma regulatory factor
MVNIKKIHKNLIISDLLASIISSRDTIDILEKIIKKVDNKSIDLDFSNVKFVSRSAAYALLSMREKLQVKKDIYFINTNKNVANMLRVVAANRIVPQKKKPEFNPKKTSIKSLFKKVLA